MSVTLHGQKKLVDPDPCNVVDALVELWLAASLTAEMEGVPSKGAGGGAGRAEAAAEVSSCSVMPSLFWFSFSFVFYCLFLFCAVSLVWPVLNVFVLFCFDFVFFFCCFLDGRDGPHPAIAYQFFARLNCGMLDDSASAKGWREDRPTIVQGDRVLDSID